MDAYRQIRKYIAEGKFRGIFSNVQMFVVSNAVDTKYFAAARDTELNRKFLTGWIDEYNHPVCDCRDFAEAVLKIPMAHEMVTKYIVLDNDKRKLLILRPYQIHAIEAMRAASKIGKSGFIWHTTGSGKTMTSYKATRNLLMDIPSIEKTVFLIDRKDLDMQIKGAFQSYADNDTIDVDDTENVNSLIQKMSDNNRQMIVTTRQKMQIMIKKRLKEGTKRYDRIRSLKIAFVVDECHRAVTPQTKRELERFFGHSIWFGFTGTPVFGENGYEQKGDLPQTTEQLYGPCLHSYTIKKALPDFPKIAITFSVTENEETSRKNQDAMKRYLVYYNKLFNTEYRIEGINAYNNNLNDRLARKEKKYQDREQQIDLVIVVDRLLTGFDAPCLSTLFIDRPPMKPQGLIQAFSRTNRLYDQNKQYGQIVTFRNPKEYKEKIDKALILYSVGGIGKAIAEDWDTVLENFIISLKAIRTLAPTPADVHNLSEKQKKMFIRLFRDLDHDFAHLKSFSVYEPEMLDKFNFSQDEYDNYAAVYKNVIEELKQEWDESDSDEEPIRDDYDLIAYNTFRIDFEYIVELLRGFVKLLEQKEDYAAYKAATPDALPKFKFNNALIKDFKETLMPEISPLFG